MKQPLRALIVEDNPVDAELIMAELQREGFETAWERVDTETAYLARLTPELDIILSDDRMPHFRGMRALELLKARGLDTPFIIVSGTIDENDAVAAMRAGAADYLLKDRLARLGSAVRRALQQKRTEEAARTAKMETERNLSLLETSFDTLAEGVVISDMDGLVFFWNRAALAIHDFTSQDECRRLLPELQETFEFVGLDGALLAFDQWPLSRILQGETVSSWEGLLRKKGPGGWKKWLSFSGALAFDQRGSPSLAVLSIEDITKRKRAEQAVQRSQAMLKLVLNTIPQGVFWKDLDSRYLGCNALVAQTFGLNGAEEVTGKADRDFASITPEQAAFFVQKDREVMVSGQPQLGIIEQATFAGGLTRWLETNKTPLYDSAGQVMGVLGTWQDITERKQAEEALETIAEQLRQVQKLESIGQLAAGIAHDFNNLLTVINCYSDLLSRQLADQPRAAECVEQIAVAGERAANLTRQLLLFSRKQVAQQRPVDLNELTHNLTKMLSRILGEDITLRIELWPGLPPICADPGMIEQVITNLSVNARDAMPEGGRLEIATSVEELDAARVVTNPEARPGRFVRLAVTDTGSGIAPEILERIFEPFFTTKEAGKGTGLGLATVYGIVMQHQGVVEVASQPNVGTRLQVFLPAAAPAHEASPETASPTLPQGGCETILLVEDEAALRSLLETILKQAGYTVLTADSGVAAQRMWPEHRDKIDLLLSDLVMPEGLSGKQLADRLKGEKPGLGVILMSGYRPETRGGAADLSEGLDFLRKPFAPPALLQAVRRRLDSSDRGADCAE